MKEVERDLKENERGRKLFNFRPMLLAAAFFALGILFAFKALSFWWLFMAVPVFGLAIIFSGQRAKMCVALLGLALAFSVGAIAFSWEVSDYLSGEYFSGTCTITGVVTDKKTYSYSSVLTLASVTIDGTHVDGVLVATMGYLVADDVEISDEVILSGDVTSYTSVFSDGELIADEIADNIRYLAESDSVQVTGKQFDLFRFVRIRLKNTLYAGMDEDAAGVTYALLTGDTSGIESGLLTNIRYGGIAHVFAVSGLHVGALYAFACLFLKKTRLRRIPAPVKFILVGALLFFYGGVCGFSASVLRASIMCLVLYASECFYVKSDFLENAGVAALILLIVRPVYLFTLGFELSFAACLSIGVFARTIEDGLCFVSSKILRRSTDYRVINAEGNFFTRIANKINGFLAISLSAQIGTAPILLHSFGYLSVWGFLLNCVFVPLVSAVFAFLLALTFIAALLPLSWAFVVLYLPYMLFSGVLLIFYAFDFSFVLDNVVLGVAVLPYYAFFVLLSDKINLRIRIKILLGAFLLFLFVECMVAANL